MEIDRGSYRRNRIDIKKTAEKIEQLAQMEPNICGKSMVDIQPETAIATEGENDVSMQ